MRAIVQKVISGGVDIPASNYKEEINAGLVILLGVKEGDTKKEAEYVADKCSALRIFSEKDANREQGNDKMSLSVKDINGEALIISQFTLYGDTSRGNRPDFTKAAKPGEALNLYQSFIDRMKFNLGSEKIKTGIFGEMMMVKIMNDGPVTIIVESK